MNEVIQATEVKDVVVLIDDQEHRVIVPVTGRALLQAAGVTPEVGLNRIMPDGTQVRVEPDSMVDLTQELRFKHRPRFRRG